MSGPTVHRMLDLHCHPLPAVDDGPARIDESLDMLTRAASGGIRTIVATPHVSAAYPDTTATIVAAKVSALQAAADAAHIDIRLVAGAELELLHREMLTADALAGL